MGLWPVEPAAREDPPGLDQRQPPAAVDVVVGEVRAELVGEQRAVAIRDRTHMSGSATTTGYAARSVACTSRLPPLTTAWRAAAEVAIMRSPALGSTRDRRKTR